VNTGWSDNIEALAEYAHAHSARLGLVSVETKFSTVSPDITVLSFIHIHWSTAIETYPAFGAQRLEGAWFADIWQLPNNKQQPVEDQSTRILYLWAAKEGSPNYPQTVILKTRSPRPGGPSLPTDPAAVTISAMIDVIARLKMAEDGSYRTLPRIPQALFKKNSPQP